MVPMELRQSMVRTCIPAPHVAEHSLHALDNQLVSDRFMGDARRAASIIHMLRSVIVNQTYGAI